MLKFFSTPAVPPGKRSPEDRVADFGEIYIRFSREEATAQADRCSQCGVPFCQIHCPLGNNIPDWLRMTAEGRLDEAFLLAQETNSFPEICGRVCPQDRLCEGNCVVARDFGAITIGEIETFITETAFGRGRVPSLRPREKRNGSVGIIGSGPAGLAAAGRLCHAGHAVTLIERDDRPGGLLTYGIPGFKMEKSVVARRVDLLREGGVGIITGCEVGRDMDLADLRARHDAILIAAGASRPREIDCPGHGLPGILQASDYLAVSCRRVLGDPVPGDGTMDARGKAVVVIGGGDTAMDCARTATRQGAASVHCLYRRNRESMPGSKREVDNAIEEKVRFLWHCQPVAFDAAGDRIVVRTGVTGAARRGTGRREPVRLLSRDGETLEADMVILALGYDPEPLPALLSCPGLGTRDDGTLEVGPESFLTSEPGVFAAGDIIRGASLVVWAIRDGQEAALAIGNHLASLPLRAAG